ncbi:hypothetical protein FEM48_Zijuj06G0108400 [Ziziphus jujuba var. spinosa]|uniref:Uncharacterized protein n=1 Tax=Ziziphus jujuba var. spinosa TaxID=714518 RepID=A0A978V8V0_ZIZJJ|nr:hypothetical protein FEM48_Zijuj06G0108400 [Ziziphus jujuba var. spinosa]
MSTTASVSSPYSSIILQSSRSGSPSKHCQASIFHSGCLAKRNEKCHFLGNSSSLYLKTSHLEMLITGKTKMDMVVNNGVVPGPPFPDSDTFPGSWKGWILGLLMTVILPFLTNKWGPLLKFKKDVETAVDTAEDVLEKVEKVAEDIGKVADEIGDHLPEGAKLRKAAQFVEDIAKETVKDINLAEDIIDKVEDVEKDVESFIGPSVNNQADKTTQDTNAKSA